MELVDVTNEGEPTVILEDEETLLNVSSIVDELALDEIASPELSEGVGDGLVNKTDRNVVDIEDVADRTSEIDDKDIPKE